MYAFFDESKYANLTNPLASENDSSRMEFAETWPGISLDVKSVTHTSDILRRLIDFLNLLLSISTTLGSFFLGATKQKIRNNMIITE